MPKEIIIVTFGGIGDLLNCTPTIKAVKESYPNSKVIVYCHKKSHQEVLAKDPNIDSLRLLKPLAMLRYPYHLYALLTSPDKIKYYHMHFQIIPLSFVYKKSVKEVVPEVFADLNIQLKSTRVQIYFTAKEEEKARRALAPYKNVIVMHTKSLSSENHHWPLERWEALVKELPEYTFIQTGTASEPYVKGALDWRNKLSIRESLCILKYADSFVGIESSMAHATNAFDIPGVVLFGDTSPVHFGHENNINIYKSVRCSPCYFYMWNSPCAYTHDCMNLITVEEVKNALMQQMNKRTSGLSAVKTPMSYATI